MQYNTVHSDHFLFLTCIDPQHLPCQLHAAPLTVRYVHLHSFTFSQHHQLPINSSHYKEFCIFTATSVQNLLILVIFRLRSVVSAMDNSSAGRNSHPSFDQPSQSDGAASSYTHNASVQQDQSHSSETGRQRLHPHHIPSLPGMPQSRHELREPLPQSTLLGQLPSMKEPDNSATPFPFRPLLEPNLPNSLGDATISPSSSQVSTGTGCIANTGLPHDVFASSSGSNVLLSPSLARDPQREQQHLHTPQLRSSPEMLPNQHDLNEPLPQSNLLGQQLSTKEPAKSAKAKLVCPECKRSCSYPSDLKRHNESAHR